VQRLDALQSALWDKAMAADVNAAQAAIRPSFFVVALRV
jgi:hypothetical protein